jgi:hypothetical protein
MLGHMAMGLAAFVGVGPVVSAQDSRVLDPCKSVGTLAEAEERPMQVSSGSGTGIFVAAPIGRVCVDPEVVDGEAIYVRRTAAKEGMAIVEVSTTPFAPDLPTGAAIMTLRPDQPAGW